MEERQQPGLQDLIKNLTDSFFQLIRDVMLLAKAEAALAKRSLVVLLLLSFLAAALLMTLWIGIQALFFLGLLHFHYSQLIALCIVTAVNFLLFMLVVVRILKVKEYLFFPATRRQLQRQINDTQEVPHE